MSSENSTGFLKGVFATLATLAALVALYEFAIKYMIPSSLIAQATPSPVVVINTQVAQETTSLPTQRVEAIPTAITPPTATSKPATVSSLNQRERFRVDASIPKNRTEISVPNGNTLHIEYLDGQWTGEQGKQPLHTGCGIYFDDPFTSHIYTLDFI